MNNGETPSIPAAHSIPRVAVVVSRFNGSITSALLKGAVAEYVKRGGEADSVAIFDAPGSFELPQIALVAAKSGKFEGVVALGCLIRGETRHDRHIAEAVARGLMVVSLKTSVPVAFGVLTVENAKQARARAGGKRGNKGEQAMAAVLDAAECVGAIRDGASRWTTEGRAAADHEDKAVKPRPKKRVAAGKSA